MIFRRLFGRQVPELEPEPEPETPEPEPEPVEAATHTEMPPPMTRVVAEVVHSDVTGKRHVVMYFQGAQVLVPVESVSVFQSLGYVFHAAVDLPDLVGQVELLSISLGPKVRRFCDECLRDGAIDAHEGMALHEWTRTYNELGKALEKLMQVIAQQYPVRQGS